MTSSSSAILSALQPLFRPRNVAVVGASRSPGKPASLPVRYLKQGGFPGGIYPVNPSGGEIDGIRCYASISEVPARIDCALLVVPSAAAVATVRQCAAHGVRSIIVASTGYAELGTDEGRDRQAQILQIVREHGIRILGPNTNGIFNATDRFSLGYNTSHGDPFSAGPISVAAHSGALFNTFLPRLRQLGRGLSKFVPVGSEADISLLDCVEYFIADPATHIIGLIIEGIADGDRLRRLAAQAHQAGKPIVALKLARSRAGAGAAMAHSSRLAGSARAYDALFAETNIAPVPSVEALAGACAMLAARRTSGNARRAGLVCLATTGGGASLTADFAEARGIELAGEPDGSWKGAVAEVIATFDGATEVRNPTDTGSLGGHHRIETLFLAQEREGYTGPAVFFTHVVPGPGVNENLARLLIARNDRTGSPSVVIAPGSLPDGVEAMYREHGVPLFHDTATAFDSLGAYCTQLLAPAVESAVQGIDIDALRRRLAPVLIERKLPSLLSEIDSSEVLRAAGIPMVTSRIIATPQDAALEAGRIGYPVVLKALAPEIAHKNRYGLVATDIGGPEELAAAYVLLQKNLSIHGFPSHRSPIIVQPMIKARAELILGVSFESGLGNFLVLGLGGINTEILDEVILFPIPSSAPALLRRIGAARIGKLMAALDAGVTAQIVSLLQALAALVQAFPQRIESIDINPLLIGRAGCIAVDALVLLREVPSMKIHRS